MTNFTEIDEHLVCLLFCLKPVINTRWAKFQVSDSCHPAADKEIGMKYELIANYRISGKMEDVMNTWWQQYPTTSRRDIDDEYKITTTWYCRWKYIMDKHIKHVMSAAWYSLWHTIDWKCEATTVDLDYNDLIGDPWI